MNVAVESLESIPSPVASGNPLKATARKALAQVPLGVWDRLFPKDVIGLCYHIVSDEPLPHARFYDFKSARQFRDDVLFLKERYELISYDQLLELREEREDEEPQAAHNRVIITFDDGFAECFDVVRPILKRHKVPCVFFITTNFIDNLDLFFECKLALCADAIEKLSADHAAKLAGNLPLASNRRRQLTDNDHRIVGSRLRGIDWQDDWSEAHRSIFRWMCELFQSDEGFIDELCGMLGINTHQYQRSAKPFMSAAQIKLLAKDGFTIGAHTRSHANLNDLSPDEVEHEIVNSATAIRDLTGQSQVPFAFPYNGADLDRAFLADIQDRHPFIRLFFDTGELMHDSPHIVHRIGADSPEQSRKGRSNLPYLLRKCWSKRSAWRRGT